MSSTFGNHKWSPAVSDNQKLDISQTLKRISALIVSIAAIFGIYHGLNLYIDARILEKISNPSFLRELAMSVRPSVIFDENDSVVADSGAMTYISQIAVTKGEKDSLMIVVKPYRYIGTEPILEPLDGEYAITAARGKGYDWVFELKSMNMLTFGAPKERRAERFRLEIIQ